MINFLYKALLENKSLVEDFSKYLMEKCNDDFLNWDVFPHNERRYTSFSYSYPKNPSYEKSKSGITFYCLDVFKNKYNVLSIFKQGDYVSFNSQYRHRKSIDDCLKVFTRDIMINHFL